MDNNVNVLIEHMESRNYLIEKVKTTFNPKCCETCLVSPTCTKNYLDGTLCKEASETLINLFKFDIGEMLNVFGIPRSVIK